ncbi:glycosyltransferase [Streptomyces ovatisporus]|uniref:Glycosyltransferase n=1 Tax=Streptomyces ovatisporus TaxID=1128682 RepID=A0ABV9A5D7_9ACTN
MRIGLVSGDGLPVSGLLTIFRNVVDLGREMGLVDLPVVADLGYTWRPDKPAFFPHGAPAGGTPDWMTVESARRDDGADLTSAGAELTEVRDLVARQETLTREQHDALKSQIERLAKPYREGFASWLRRHQIDWVFALNMTLSDAVPVTLGLHQAAEEFFTPDRAGGVLYWDHDLFRSCAIFDEETGRRLYPEKPNRYTPVPQRNAHTRWAVISGSLAEETSSYPTELLPDIVPNILPKVPDGPLEERHHAFARHMELDLSRPVLLNPVRVFNVKGVEIALDLLAGMKSAAARDGSKVPWLLVFGSLEEEPPYAKQILAHARALGIQDDIRFLDGVPVTSHPEGATGWKLDEIDLLRLARETAGGVVFTPNVPDVETVGLAPGLAAVAGLPVAVTDYDVFRHIYGDDFTGVLVDRTPEGMRRAAEEFLAAVGTGRRGSRLPGPTGTLETNFRTVQRCFPDEPWRALLQRLAKSA